jgi:phospholipid/cholesterol/gamma-HCH transport system permease protein
MSSQPSTLRPHLTKTVRDWTDTWNRIGEQTAFYVRTVRGIGQAAVRYPEETVRGMAQLAMGIGPLALIGGAVTVIVWILGNIGTATAIFGQANLNRIGITALVSFFISYAVPRLVVPDIIVIGMVATIGAGTTAQLGAMRIGEEIDALEVMGIDTVAYLASTRVLGGLIVGFPLACAGELGTFVIAYLTLTVVNHDPGGGYEHYFHTYLKPSDTFWGLGFVMVQVLVVMVIHTYYGFNASGGPAGVGEATGRSVRASMVAALLCSTLFAVAVYGRSGDFRLSG